MLDDEDYQLVDDEDKLVAVVDVGRGRLLQNPDL
jgi:hypothetical protein